MKYNNNNNDSSKKISILMGVFTLLLTWGTLVKASIIEVSIDEAVLTHTSEGWADIHYKINNAYMLKKRPAR